MIHRPVTDKPLPANLGESERVGREQVAQWRRDGVTLREASNSLGRETLNNWEAVVWAVASEWTRMRRREERLRAGGDDA